MMSLFLIGVVLIGLSLMSYEWMGKKRDEDLVMEEAVEGYKREYLLRELVRIHNRMRALGYREKIRLPGWMKRDSEIMRYFNWDDVIELDDVGGEILDSYGDMTNLGERSN